MNNNVIEKESLFSRIKRTYYKFTDKAGEWMDKGNRTTVIFLLPYILMFSIFIVLPVIFEVAFGVVLA